MVSKLTYFKRQADIIVGLFCLLLFSNCSGNKKIVASVDDNELTREKAELMMTHLGYNIHDRKDWVKFIDNWCEEQALKEELKIQDITKSELVEMRSQAFMGDLSKYYLEEKKFYKEIDSIVTEKQFLSYYNQHKNEFALQDYIVKALYLKIPKEVKEIEKIKACFLLKNDKDIAQVNSYAKLYAEDFYFDDKQWIYFNDLTKDIPIGKYNKDNIVLNRTKTYFEDNEFVYFINIIDFKVKDATPPLDFLKNQMKEIIVAQRMNDIREKKEVKLIQNIKKKHEITKHF